MRKLSYFFKIAIHTYMTETKTPYKTVRVSIVLLILLSLPACSDKHKNRNATQLSVSHADTTFFDTTGIAIEKRAGKVHFLNKEHISHDLILVNDGSKNNRVYLMDKNAEILHEWPLKRKLGKDAYLTNTGDLLAMMMVDTTTINFGGQAGIIQLIAPDGSIRYEYEHASEEYITHHDAEMLPNGNILLLVWEKKSETESALAGSELGIALYPEAIIEIEPTSNRIVWEWHAWDHLVQEVDPGKENYGLVSAHPERIDLNYVTTHEGDIMHANGLAYDPHRKLIFLTINWFSEVWVIDHSTTSEEAASTRGGQFNKGGDLIYRFGNPEAYRNKAGKRLLDQVHTPFFVEFGAPPFSHMLVFSNKTDGQEQSTVYEIEIPEILNLEPGIDNEPNVVWSFTHPDLYGGRISGAARLPNGNTLITEGDYGIWEVSSDKEVVWKFEGEGAFFWRSYPFGRESEEIKSILAD